MITHKGWLVRINKTYLLLLDHTAFGWYVRCVRCKFVYCLQDFANAKN